MTISGLSFDESIMNAASGTGAPGFSHLGAHESAAGGPHRAVERIAALGGTALQLFTRNQRQWSTPALTDREVRAFVAARRAWGGHPVASHASYLINLASPDETAWRRGIAALAAELDRCRTLGVAQVVLHPGSALGAPAAKALARTAAGLDACFEQAGDATGTAPVILLENVAGQGSSLGKTFEELAAIMEKCRYASRLGLCFDTCHGFAAGYDLSGAAGYAATFERLDAVVGLRRLGLIHVNDSKHPLASGKDRHEHIGRGTIGLAGFARLMTDPALAAVPKVLETHKSESLIEDAHNLAVLRALKQGRDPRPHVWPGP